MPEKELSLLQKNLRYLRKSKGISQDKLGESLGISRHNIGAYEEGRSMPSFENILEIADHFGISADALGRADFADMTRDELEALQLGGKQIDIRGKSLRVLAVTTDAKGKENIELIPEKAAAGYLSEHDNPAYLEELPKFQLPMLSNGTHRAFEIEGDSMLPIPSGSVIVSEYVENWERDIKEGDAYIIVSQKRGIVFKRIYNPIETDSSLAITCVSDNSAYPPYELELEPEDEIWKAKMVMNTDLSKPESAPTPSQDNNLSIESLYPVILKMQQEIIELKGQGQA